MQVLDYNNHSDSIAVTANVADSSYTFILHDQSVCSMDVNEGAGGGVGATTPFFLGEDDAPNSKTLVASSVNIGVGAPVNVQKHTINYNW